MALNDLMAEVRGSRGPLQRIEDRRLAQDARDLERLKVGSEAFYKQQLGLSEMASRRPDNTLQQIQNDPNMPRIEQFIQQGMSPEQIKQGQQDFFRAQATYIQSTYPAYAEKLGIKGSDVRQATSEVDVTAKQEEVKARTEMQEAQRDVFRSGVGAEGTTPTESMLWEAENFLKEQGKGTLWGWGSPATADVMSLATRAQQLQQADAAAGMPVQDAKVYLQRATEAAQQPQPQAGPAVPQAPQAPQAPTKLREIDLTKTPGMMR